MKPFNYLIVGSGITGAVLACELSKIGKRCLVLEKRSHIGGNIYDIEQDGIFVHRYGAHIFHTSNQDVWNYITKFGAFNNFINSPVANYKGEIYNLPFNMNTFSKLWGIVTPQQATERLNQERIVYLQPPKNLEEQALLLVGSSIYEKLIKGYTEKQWGRRCCDLPAFIINRIPLRFTYNNNYFNDLYQGIPIEGYTKIIAKMLDGIETNLGVDYFDNKNEFDKMADYIIYTGMIDRYFNYSFGRLEYRSLRFEDIHYETENYQGVAVMNFTDSDTPYTRSIEHKHFMFGSQPNTIVTREYPVEWCDGHEPYYPVNDSKNQQLYYVYKELADQLPNVFFCGRLAEYHYYDMDKAIESALRLISSGKLL